MSDAIVLDSSPLALLCHPKNSLRASECRRWAERQHRLGRRVIVPEISDYEIRREFIRRSGGRSLALLDRLGERFEYLPLSTAIMRRAAELWAHLRTLGRPSASTKKLDADVLLMAQAMSLLPGNFIIATANVRHFMPLVRAELWENIQ